MDLSPGTRTSPASGRVRLARSSAADCSSAMSIARSREGSVRTRGLFRDALAAVNGGSLGKRSHLTAFANKFHPAHRLTGKPPLVMLRDMQSVRSAQLWWWRWSPAIDAARPTNG
jgi:hypothetical protein